MNDYRKFAPAFYEAIRLATPYIHSKCKHGLSGSEMNRVSTAIQTAGFARPTPQMIDAVAKCVHLGERQRQRIIDRERTVFFGLKPARLSIQEMPGALQTVSHDAVPASLELLSARMMTFVLGASGLGIRC